MRVLWNWIKWKTYIRWKDTWGTFFFTKGKVSSTIGLIAVLIDCVKALFFSVAYYSVFKLVLLNRSITQFESETPIIKFFLQELAIIQNNEIYFWNLYWLVLFIFCLFVGYKSSRWAQFSEDKFLLESHLGLPDRQVNFFLFLESIAWNFRTFIMNLLSLNIALLLATNSSFFDIFIYICSSVLLYIFLSLLFTCLHYLYVVYRTHWINGRFLIFQLISTKLLAIYIGFLSASQLYNWVQQAPFFSNEFTSQELNDWYFMGIERVEELLFFPIRFVGLPHNFWSINLYHDNLLVLFICLCVIFIIIIFVYKSISMVKIDTYSTNTGYVILPILEKIHHWFLFNTGIVRKNANYLKTFYRSPLMLKKINGFGGDLLFWILTGVFAGLLGGVSFEGKGGVLFIFLLSYYHVFFYCESFFSSYKGLISLDGEGQNALLYSYTIDNLWILLKKKIFTANIYIGTTLLFSDIAIFLISSTDLIVMIWILINQFIVMAAFNILLFIPSVYNPHFNFFNIEQLDDYADRKFTSSTVTLTIVGILLPIMMIPCIFYMIGSFDLKALLLFNALSLLMIIAIMIPVLLMLKKRTIKKDLMFSR
ncbi:MAG: hypothetical protein ACFWT6_12445 [Virgibacillus proomii]